MTSGETAEPCDVCDGTGDVFIYQGEGDYIENPCGRCEGAGVVLFGSAREGDQ